MYELILFSTASIELMASYIYEIKNKIRENMVEGIYELIWDPKNIFCVCVTKQIN